MNNKSSTSIKQDLSLKQIAALGLGYNVACDNLENNKGTVDFSYKGKLKKFIKQIEKEEPSKEVIQQKINLWGEIRNYFSHYHHVPLKNELYEKIDEYYKQILEDIERCVEDLYQKEQLYLPTLNKIKENKKFNQEEIKKELNKTIENLYKKQLFNKDKKEINRQYSLILLSPFVSKEVMNRVITSTINTSKIKETQQRYNLFLFSLLSKKEKRSDKLDITATAFAFSILYMPKEEEQENPKKDINFSPSFHIDRLVNFLALYAKEHKETGISIAYYKRNEYEQAKHRAEDKVSNEQAKHRAEVKFSYDYLKGTDPKDKDKEQRPPLLEYVLLHEIIKENDKITEKEKKETEDRKNLRLFIKDNSIFIKINKSGQKLSLPHLQAIVLKLITDQKKSLTDQDTQLSDIQNIFLKTYYKMLNEAKGKIDTPDTRYSMASAKGTSARSSGNHTPKDYLNNIQKEFKKPHFKKNRKQEKIKFLLKWINLFRYKKLDLGQYQKALYILGGKTLDMKQLQEIIQLKYCNALYKDCEDDSPLEAKFGQQLDLEKKLKEVTTVDDLIEKVKDIVLEIFKQVDESEDLEMAKKLATVIGQRKDKREKNTSVMLGLLEKGAYAIPKKVFIQELLGKKISLYRRVLDFLEQKKIDTTKKIKEEKPKSDRWTSDMILLFAAEYSLQNFSTTEESPKYNVKEAYTNELQKIYKECIKQKDNIRRIEFDKDLFEQEVTISIELDSTTYYVKVKLGNLYRVSTKLGNEDYLKGIVKYYLDSQTKDKAQNKESPVLWTLDKDATNNKQKNPETSDPITLKESCNKAEKERAMLMQAILEYEKNQKVIDDDYKKDKDGKKTHVLLNTLLKNDTFCKRLSNQDDIIAELYKMRNKAFHMQIGDNKFSKISYPLSKEYETIKTKKEETRKKYQKRAIKEQKQDSKKEITN